MSRSRRARRRRSISPARRADTSRATAFAAAVADDHRLLKVLPVEDEKGAPDGDARRPVEERDAARGGEASERAVREEVLKEREVEREREEAEGDEGGRAEAFEGLRELHGRQRVERAVLDREEHERKRRRQQNTALEPAAR